MMVLVINHMLDRILKRYRLKQLIFVISDLFLLAFGFLVSSYLITGQFASIFFQNKYIFICAELVQILVFLRFGLYRAILRYASIDFLITVLKAVTSANLVLILFCYIFAIKAPPSVMVVNWLIGIFLVGGSRFVVRYYFEFKQRFQSGRRVLIYGAGDMGSLALRQLLLNKAVLYSPVGFIDDDKKKTDSVIRGVKVLGTLESLENVLEQFKVEEVVVAISEIDSDNLRAVVKRCKGKGIVCRIIPCFSRLVEMEPNIRNVELADLMRRSPRDLDKEAISKYLHRKNILVTGAAGSIGSEIVRQCLTYGPSKVFALDQSEYGLYALNEELGTKDVRCILCDTTNILDLEGLFRNNKPEIVFHAAAYKHVPLLEDNPVEAVRNNVSSTKNLCELSDKYGVKSLVMISTDKAVRPSSIMGATKRICELIVQNFDKRSETEFVSVRFGNVLGSSGSVVPKFIDQIRKGVPITVTHPDATRYFMLIDEAVQLVLQAASIGNGGEIFILDMGKPVKIVDMAEDLIYLMGRQPYKDINIEFSGMRPGEKVHEELFNDEIEEPTKFKEITVGKPKVLDWEWLNGNVNELLSSAHIKEPAGVVKIMKELVPDGNFGANMQ